jgi:predicted ArsR family transcriptional regulator
MNTQQKILKFCLTPQIVIDIAEHCGLEKASIYSHLLTLQRSGKIEKRGDGKRRANPAVFVTIKKPPVATESTDEYQNLVLIWAHNPFGSRL